MIKLVVIEEGSDLAAQLWGTRNRVATGLLSYAEGRAALAAARRGGRLTSDTYRQARKGFDSVIAELSLIGIDEPLARHAVQLAEDLELRGYDAVHLASALALGADTTMVTWDRDLAQAAMHSGCAIAPTP